MFSSEKWFGGGADNFYSHTIDQSLRFEDGDNPYLSKTLSGSGGTIFTFSCWIKLGNLSINRQLLQGYSDGNNFAQILLYSGNYIGMYSATSGTARLYAYTQALQRDPNAWYNIVVKFNGTSGSEEFKIYVNGENQTLTTSTSLSAHQSNIGNSNAHYVGNNFNQSQDMDGYMAEVNFIDGTALDADSFGETKAGIWIPKDTSGLTFGTNGFRLKFQDSSALGDDTSGNGNDFSSSGLAATDVVPDSPSNNFAVFNSILPIVQDFHEGNLKCNSTENNYEIQAATVFPSNVSGKWYAEFYIHTVNGSTLRVGVGVTSINTNPTLYLGEAADDIGYYEVNDIWRGGSKIADTDASFTAGDIVSVALDLDAGEVTFRKNNLTMSNGTQSLTSNTLYTIATSNYGTLTAGVIANFGQDNTFSGTKSDGAGAADANGVGEFYYSPPSGYLALCAANLSNPGIDPAQDEEPADYFNTVLYTGNGSSYTDTQAISGVGFSPDWTWIKARSASYSHVLNDRVRGAGKNLFSDSDTTENVGGSTGDLFTSFDSDGFTVNYKYGGGSNAAVNGNGTTYVAWNWLAGGSASTIAVNSVSSGVPSIESSVSANTKSGFSIVSFDLQSSGSKTVGHGLSAAPELYFVKSRTSPGGHWFTYYGDATDYITLNNPSAGSDDDRLWDDTSPTSTVFTVGSLFTSGSYGAAHIAYCFHSVEGYSKIGTFVGSGATAFVYTGFKPAFLLIKNLDEGTGANWGIFDNTRPDGTGGTSGVKFLQADLSNPEGNSSTVSCFFFSNGFEIGTSNVLSNASGDNFLYLAIAKQPFKYANAQ